MVFHSHFRATADCFEFSNPPPIAHIHAYPPSWTPYPRLRYTWKRLHSPYFSFRLISHKMPIFVWLRLFERERFWQIRSRPPYVFKPPPPLFMFTKSTLDRPQPRCLPASLWRLSFCIFIILSDRPSVPLFFRSDGTPPPPLFSLLFVYNQCHLNTGIPHPWFEFPAKQTKGTIPCFLYPGYRPQ